MHIFEREFCCRHTKTELKNLQLLSKGRVVNINHKKNGQSRNRTTLIKKHAFCFLHSIHNFVFLLFCEFPFGLVGILSGEYPSVPKIRTGGWSGRFFILFYQENLKPKKFPPAVGQNVWGGLYWANSVTIKFFRLRWAQYTMKFTADHEDPIFERKHISQFWSSSIQTYDLQKKK